MISKKCILVALCFVNTFFLLLGQSVHYAITFVHIGQSIPAHVSIAVKQARLFNPDADIYLLCDKKICSQELLHVLQEARIALVPYKNLPMSEEHKRFMDESKLDKQSLNGFWFKTTERFFYLAELAKYLKLTHVFHMEHDNLIYVNLLQYLNFFGKQRIAAVFDNDNRCIPGFLYFSGASALKHITTFIADYAHRGLNDMAIIAEYKNVYGSDYVTPLPLIMPEYADKHSLESTAGHKAQDKTYYYRNFEFFHSIFDAAALGQYLGGVSPLNAVPQPGFINESCVFNPAHFLYVWKKDEAQRLVPYVIFEDKMYRINNLHIHSKQLEKFQSWS